jgi:prolyl oligopeptidase
MKRWPPEQSMYRLLVIALSVFVTSCGKTPSLKYPATARGPVVETLFGEAIADPYRWLENDVRNDQQVQDWVTAENAVTDAYLATLPGREAIRERLSKLWNYERFGVPEKAGKNYFYAHNTGLQNQSVLFVRTGLDGMPRQLIDPNTWAKDGATALAEWMPSHDGTRLAYAIQDGGTDWRTIRVLDVATGEPLADEIKWAKFSNIAWARDGSGIYYSRFAEPAEGLQFQSLNENQQLYFHRIGTAQSDDRLIHATPDQPLLGHSADVTDDGAWLVIYTYQGTDDRYEVTLLDLRHRDARPVKVIRGLEHNWVLAGSHGDTLYFITNKDAPRQKIVAIDAARPAATPREIVPQDASTIDSASLVGDVLLVSYLVDAQSEVRRFALDGKPLGKVPLPGIGSAGGFGGEAGDPETFFSFASFNLPTAIFHYDSASGEVTPFATPAVAFNPDDFTVEQRFYQSKDGTRIPIFLMYRKGLKLDGGVPTLLYAYGGFNVPMTPGFNPANLAWVELGGVYALANIRGGGEYGKTWHDAGRLTHKQNVFDDFIAAGEFLIAEGITTKDRLAIRGGSNGGLLIGAVVNQRPDLFAAALPQVGVMDMLRFNRFTAGRYWVDDYGDPGKEADFRLLRAYSPYHNIRAGVDYPPILATTADTDDRVVPGHTFKYVAALQAADIGDKPHLVRIETRAGHGSGKPTDKTIAEYADMWAFIARWTGLTVRWTSG